jgi:hypothetical protein
MSDFSDRYQLEIGYNLKPFQKRQILDFILDNGVILKLQRPRFDSAQLPCDGRDVVTKNLRNMMNSVGVFNIQ